MRITNAGPYHELVTIKQLLILQLVTSGVRVDDIAHVLAMSRRELLKIIPFKWIARQGRVA